MIVVKLMGGLGNQMFQYATARRLSIFRNTDLFLDVSSYDNIPDSDTPREYNLDWFNIKASVATKKQLSKVKPADFTPPALLRAKRKLFIDKDNLILQVGEKSKSFQPSLLKAKDNTYLTGWWQNEKYFLDIRDILLKEFTAKLKPSKKNSQILDSIINTQSVSLHVRRGDYLTNPNAKSYHGVPTIEYYQKAIKHLENKYNDINYFVFSDDIKWCKQNLGFIKKVTFVDGNDNKSYEDMRLMSNCKHNIIANSSFSWWGAWLNNYKDKVVIAPKTWFLDKQANKETEIVSNSWIRI